jgi:hypothetical protein
MKTLIIPEIKKLSFVFIVIIFIVGCDSNSLSRDKAKGLITKAYKLPLPQTEYFYKYYTKHDHFFNAVNEIDRGDEPMLDAFSNKGLITLSKNTTYEKVNAWGKTPPIINFVVKLTTEGKKYLVSEDNSKYTVKTSDLDMDEITDILNNEQSKTAIVEYSLIRNNWTPFGEYYKTINPAKYPEQTPGKSNLQKYDDGWRVVDNRGNQ